MFVFVLSLSSQFFWKNNLWFETKEMLQILRAQWLT